MRRPEEVGLSRAKLDELRDLVGGRGCIVRHGYLAYTWGDVTKSGDVASAVKPVISTLLFFAVQEGKLKSVDDIVSDFESRLRELGSGKDAAITWRHFASQTSGYGLVERPGEAYSYNDYALALYYDTLTQKVFGENGTNVLKTRLVDALQFEDRYTFEAFGPGNRSGRLAISVRDFARFGLLWLHGGMWGDRQLLRPELVHLALNSPVPANMPLTSGRESEMLPNQRSLGGGKNITSVGPGFYSFNWWLNRTDRAGHRLLVDAPPDTFVASGHGGKRALWIIPSLDLIVSWNDARVEDHDKSPGNPDTGNNRAARLMREAVVGETATKLPRRKTDISIRGDAFYINGRPTYAGRVWHGYKIEGLLMNARMVQGIFDDLNPDTRGKWVYPDTGIWDAERNTREFIAAMSEWRRHGLLAFTINLQGGNPRSDGGNQPWHNSAITETGELRPDYMARLERILDRADELGMVVILGIFYFGQDQRIQDEAAVVRALDNAVDWVFDHDYRNVLIEVNNECNVRYDHAILRPGRVHELIERVKSRPPATAGKRDSRRLLVSVSYGGATIPSESVVRSADFLLLHGNSVHDPNRIAEMVHQTRGVAGYRPMPILFNEDDNCDFDKLATSLVGKLPNNMIAAVSEHASWGYFDFRRKGEGFDDGYQSVPVNWQISSPRKRAFFARIKEITGE